GQQPRERDPLLPWRHHHSFGGTGISATPAAASAPAPLSTASAAHALKAAYQAAPSAVHATRSSPASPSLTFGTLRARYSSPASTPQAARSTSSMNVQAYTPCSSAVEGRGTSRRIGLNQTCGGAYQRRPAEYSLSTCASSPVTASSAPSCRSRSTPRQCRRWWAAS